MNGYVMVTNRLFLVKTRALSKEMESGSTAKVSSQNVKELKIAKYRITFWHFTLSFIFLNDFCSLIFLDDHFR